MRAIKNQKGFSLLEVIIVVGLIGVISGISVPTYIRQNRIAKTSEAQSSLGQIYMAEKAFFLQWRFYASDLLAIGISPDGEMLYNAGFSKGTSAPPATYKGPTLETNKHTFLALCKRKFGSGDVKSCAFKNRHNKNGFTPPAIPDGYFAENNSFKAAAIADLINKTPKKLNSTNKKDIWSIDQYKQIIRVQDGTK